MKQSHVSLGRTKVTQILGMVHKLGRNLFVAGSTIATVTVFVLRGNALKAGQDVPRDNSDGKPLTVKNAGTYKGGRSGKSG